MKRLHIGFDGEPHGSIALIDGKLHLDGPNQDALTHHIEAAGRCIARKHGFAALTPAAILKHLADTLQGRTHAHWQDDEAAAARSQAG